MQAYEARKSSYFSTPAVQLIIALNKSLELILSHGMENLFELHRVNSQRVKSHLHKLGLRLVPVNESCAANAMSAVYVPKGVQLAQLVAKMSEKGVVIAGGLVPEIATKYFRIGHMGVSVSEGAQRGDVDMLLKALDESLSECEGMWRRIKERECVVIVKKKDDECGGKVEFL